MRQAARRGGRGAAVAKAWLVKVLLAVVVPLQGSGGRAASELPVAHLV